MTYSNFPFSGFPSWEGSDASAMKIAWYENEGIPILNLEGHANSLQPKQTYNIEQVTKNISFNNGNVTIDGTLDVSGNTTLSGLL